MTVYDRWHRDGGEEPCREHSRGRAKLYPSAVHGTGLRWQVRYRDDAGRQRSRSFRVKEGSDPGRHADAFDAMISHQLHRGDYIDPDAGNVTLQEFAEDWRKNRRHDTTTARKLAGRLRNHVYEDPAHPGRTRKGGVAIGQRRLRELANRPSLIAAWIAAMPLRESSAHLAVADVSAIFRAAVADGLARQDPTGSASVTRPRRGGRKARPWTLRQLEAMSQALPPRYEIIPWLGAGTGMRQGELFGLAAEDIVFLGRHPHITVRRQVKMIAGRMFFAPVKNRKPHEVPLAGELARRLARHMKDYPPLDVTLDWHDLRDAERHGRPVTVRLVLARGGGRAWNSPRFNEGVWHPAQERAGITPPRAGKREPARADGCHALRHTFASVQLRAGVDAVRVAAWMGDTPAVVLSTYAHLMPDSGDDGRAAVDAFFGELDAPVQNVHVT